MERRGGIDLSYDLGDLVGIGAAVAVTLFHPGKNKAALVAAAADLAAVQARVRPQFGKSLCVVPSSPCCREPRLTRTAHAAGVRRDLHQLGRRPARRLDRRRRRWPARPALLDQRFRNGPDEGDQNGYHIGQSGCTQPGTIRA